MKALLFDFGGTLDSDGVPWGDRFYPLYKDAGLRAGRENWNRAFYKSDDNLHQRFKLTGSLDETVARQVACVLEELAPEKQSQAKIISDRFIADCRRHFARNKPVLARLKKRFKLGIVSNFYGNLAGIVESEGLGEYFEVVADSLVVGHSKPSREIFLHALGGLGAKPAECLMVGDSVNRDMRGAESLGMAHALLGPRTQATCCPQALRLGALADLEACLP